MADEEIRLGIRLDDDVSLPSKNASLAVGSLTAALKTAKAELAGYQAQLTRAKSLGDIEGYRKYGALVNDAKRSVFELAQEVEGMRAKSAGVFGAMVGSVGPAISSLVSLVTIAAAAGVALGGLAYETLKFADGATEAKARSISLFEALGDGSEGAGKRTFAMLDDLSERLPESRKELSGWARQLEGLGITDLGALKGQVLAVASAQALAEGGAEKYLALQRKIQIASEFHRGVQLPIRGQGSLAELGVTPDLLAKLYDGGKLSAKQLGEELKHGTANAEKFGEALEKAVLQKGKGPLAELHGELSTITTKGIEDFGKLFDSVDFTPLARAASDFFSVIRGGTPSGDTLKTGMTGALNSIVHGFADALREAEIFFLKTELWVLKNKPTIKSFADEIEGVAVRVEKTVGFVVKLAEGVGRIADKLHLLRNAKDNTEEDAAAGAALAKKRDIGFFDVAGQQRAIEDAHAIRIGGEGAANGGRRAPANDNGGVVQPARGEMLASVAPGERILTRAETRQLADAGTHDDHSSSVVNHNVFQIHIDAPQGVTDAHQLSVTGLAVAIERLQLASGR